MKFISYDYLLTFCDLYLYDSDVFEFYVNLLVYEHCYKNDCCFILYDDFLFIFSKFAFYLGFVNG